MKDMEHLESHEDDERQLLSSTNANSPLGIEDWRNSLKSKGLILNDNGLISKEPLPVSFERAKELLRPDNHSEWYDLLLIETDWKLVKVATKVDPSIWTPELQRKVVFSGGLCPICETEKGALRATKLGCKTGILLGTEVKCFCRNPKVVQKVLTETVPAQRYWGVDFASLQPSTDSNLFLEFQKDEICYLKDNWTKNYLLVGPAGTSKTTYGVGIIREALKANAAYISKHSYVPYNRRINFVWWVDAEELFHQQHLYKTTQTAENPAPEPVVTPERVRKAAAHGLRPLLVLEELDKTSINEKRAEFLFRIIKAIDEAEGQLVITTNRTMERFFALFTESKDETVRVIAEPLIRRLLENCDVRNYFTAKATTITN